jgi:hypothetical protein
MRPFLALCALLLLTGCVFTESLFIINKDNSVDMSIVTKKAKDVGEAPDAKVDTLDYNGTAVVVAPFEEGEYNGTQMKAHFSLITDLNTFPLVADTTLLPAHPMVKKETHPTYSVYTISYKPNATKPFDGGESSLGDKNSEEYKEMAAMLKEILDNKVTWKVPFEVLATNAKAKNDTLGIYTWEFEGAEGDSIYLQYKVPLDAGQVAKKLFSINWIVPVLVLITGLILYLLLRRKKPKQVVYYQNPPEEQQPPEETPPPEEDKKL